MKPRLLDLFCGAGGAGMGYYRAGFEVVGVDKNPQPHYPFEFHQADALDYAAQHVWGFDAIHASPPCQAHSVITPNKSRHIDLIPQTRFWLQTIGVPYIIENVVGAPLRSPVMLCGAYFGLKVYRHRLFESNILLLVSPHTPHHDQTPSAGHGLSPKGFLSITSGGQGIKGGASEMHRFISPKGFISIAGHFSQVDYARFAMGINWMTQEELAQAIPPAYTEYLGRQLMNAVLYHRESEKAS